MGSNSTSAAALAGGGAYQPSGHSYQPLLRMASLSASALLPAYAWMEVGCTESEAGAGWALVVEMSRAEFPQYCAELCASLWVQGADLAGDTFKTTVNVQLSPISGARVGADWAAFTVACVAANPA